MRSVGTLRSGSSSPMCGIAGIVHRVERPGPEHAALQRMIAVLRHRGPDDCGIYRDGRAGLAHTRLSIIDLETGHQPLANADGRRWIVFNGEIYNYLELRRDLAGKGHRFSTRSDTEVILHAWEEWGEGALSRFNGQWAFAIWDRDARRLVLARDRLGIRPLYFVETPGRVLFASEVAALFAADRGLAREFDPLGLRQTFTFWTVVAPRTVFAGVRQVEPGHLRVYEEGGVRDRAYWQPRYEGAFEGGIDEATESVREELQRATALRVQRADVPVGSYLSGGLDSSIVAAMGSEVRTEASFRTFSIRFEDAEYDETPYQRLMAERLGSEHHEILVGRDDIARSFPAVVRHAAHPLLRTAPAPLFLLSRRVRELGVKVVLTGEGADEIFAGYDIFREGAVRRFWARQPQSDARPRLLERLYPYLARSPVARQALARAFFGHDLERWEEAGFAHGPRWRSTSALLRLVRPEMRADGIDVAAELLGGSAGEFAGWTHLARDQDLEIRTLLSGYLLACQGDRMLMAHSVEGRFPFLDHHVVELANALPDRFKLRTLDEKYVLKRAAADWVPEEIRRRTKQPYRAPDAAVFVGDGRPEWVDELLGEESLARAGVFEVGAARALWRKCLARAGQGQYSNVDNMGLVAVLSTQLLERELLRMPTPAADESVRVVDRAAGAATAAP